MFLGLGECDDVHEDRASAIVFPGHELDIGQAEQRGTDLVSQLAARPVIPDN